MVTALVCSGQLSLPEWEAYVPSRARQAQSTERRWQRFMGNRRVRVKKFVRTLGAGGDSPVARATALIWRLI